MSKVIIKTVNRKTTISKAAIKKAAKIAYSSDMNSRQPDNSRPKASAKISKAA